MGSAPKIGHERKLCTAPRGSAALDSITCTTLFGEHALQNLKTSRFPVPCT